jgi:7,8-dihydropterin-6-yl-methyl-4-(beta-D-ribofuranosyl)aminobenzene 5'-phosphate synthase
MNMKLTIAIDNCVPINAASPFLGEHGLSMLLETGDSRLLIDTGQSAAVIHNLGLLGVAPASLDLIVISHGHHDHTGGLFHILGQAKKRIPVYLHEAAFKPRFSVSQGERRFAGIPHRKDQLSSLGADWRLVREPLELLPGLWLSGAVPRTTAYETGDVRLVAPNANSGCDCQDEIDDDMALFYRSEKGLVVISGCTHSGLVNMVRHGLEVTGAGRLHGWIGGTHLGPVADPQQEATIAQLQAFKPDFVAANHCTGFRMMARLQEAFGERFIPAFVGAVIEF